MDQVLLVGVLGAAVLAIVLLDKNQRRQTARLTKIEAELAAEKIARLTQQPAPPAIPAQEEEPPEPTRRKRHLALYIGGGVAAVFGSLGARLRSLWNRSPALATTGTVTVVAVASTAAALYLPPNGSSPDTPNVPQPATVSDQPHAKISEIPGRQSGASSKDDDRAARDDTWHKNADASSFTVLRSGAEEPPELSASNETQGPPQNADQPSEPTRPTSPGQSPSGPAPGSNDPSPSPSAPGPIPNDPEPLPPSLAVGNVELADTGKRWCEDVTVELRNTGGSPATSGTVRFGTHILDLFGTDWGTVTQVRSLPAPIPAGGQAEHTWTLCVDAWRVPLGWHIDTLDVAAALN